MNIIETFYDSNHDENKEYVYYDKEYVDKNEENRNIQNQFEEVIRKNIYENPLLEKGIEQTEEVRFNKEVMRYIKDRYYMQPEHYKISIQGFIVRPNRLDIFYGLQTNFRGEIDIEIAGDRLYRYVVEDNEVCYLPLPILNCKLTYHQFSIKVVSSNIKKEDIKIEIYGIKISNQMLVNLNKSFEIDINKYMSGMFGRTYIHHELSVKIKDVYEDYGFFRKLEKNGDTIILSIHKMKIIEFHNHNGRYKKRIMERTRMISHELIERAWSPDRVEDWCLPIDVI